jgi:hypothetical protein
MSTQDCSFVIGLLLAWLRGMSPPFVVRVRRVPSGHAARWKICTHIYLLDPVLVSKQDSDPI